MSHLRGLMNTSIVDIIDSAINKTIEYPIRNLRSGDSTYNNIKILYIIIGLLLCIKFIVMIATDMKKMNEKKYTPRISEHIYTTSPPPLILSPSANGEMNVTINYDSLKSYNKKFMSMKKKPRKMSQQDIIIPINI